MNALKRLNKVRALVWVLSLGAAGVILFFSKNLIPGAPIAAALMVVVVLVERRYYRCPHCGKCLSFHLPLDDTTCCTGCGVRIAGEPEDTK